MHNDYTLPDVTGTLMMAGCNPSTGTLRELLTIYATLSAADRQRSTIMLDQPIRTPPGLQKMDGKKMRRNIFDGEGERLLAFL